MRNATYLIDEKFQKLYQPRNGNIAKSTKMPNNNL